MNQDLFHLLKEKYNFDQSSPSYLTDLKKLKKGYPLAYLIGNTPFLNCKIDLSLKPLIPRPETEYLIDKLIKNPGSLLGWWPKRSGGLLRGGIRLHILDLCCGSGCIGIALLKNLPNISVDFADISPKALKQTQINLKLNKIPKNRYKLIKSNLFDKINSKYDLIIANPPYIDKNSQYGASLKYEPSTALFASQKGLFYIKKILKDFYKYLKPTGQLYLEFAQGQDKQLKQLLVKKHHYIKDQFGINRFLHLTQS